MITAAPNSVPTDLTVNNLTAPENVACYFGTLLPIPSERQHKSVLNIVIYKLLLEPIIARICEL